MKQKRSKTIWIVILLVLALGVLFTKPILRGLGDALIVKDPL